MIKNYSFLLILFFLFACKKEEEIDKSLDTALIGTWSNGFRNYTFNADNTYSLVFTDTSDLRLFSLELLYDSIAGDFYTISGENVLVLETKLARKFDETNEIVDIKSSPEVTDYTISDNILTLTTTTSQIGYVKLD